MPLTIKKGFVVLGAALVLSAGCALKETSYSPSEADRQFIKVAQEEFQYHPVIQAAGKTLWIYLPKPQDIFTIKGSKETPAAPRKFSLQYLDGKFADHSFLIEYDIIPATKSTGSKGVRSGYSEEFGGKYQGILGAVMRIYLNTPEPPDFIVLIFADVKNGLEIENILAVSDLKNYQALVLPYEEFSKRILTESRGDPNIIGDETGKHIDGRDILWPDFLIKQIISRISFKYQQSDFAPGANATSEITTIARETLNAYHFKNFSSLKLYDVRNAASQEIGALKLIDVQ